MDNVASIINWRRMNYTTTLSGQPTESQLLQIKSLGVSNIINLAPHSNKGALDDEAGFVASLGMVYINIPVDFENPTEIDYKTFCDVIERLSGKLIHVHCIYNARVTAFYYRYAAEGRGGSPDAAYELMDGIWRPGGVWAKFIGKADAFELPNRYAGEDY